MTGYFIINGVKYYPQAMTQEYESLATADSGRTDDGVMHIEYVKRRLHKLNIQMPPSEIATYTALMNAIQGNPSITVRFFDAMTNTEIQREMYCSNSSTDWYSGVIKGGLVKGWKFNLIDTGRDSV